MQFNIAVLPGDGIGPEVTAESVKVMDAVGRAFGHGFNFEYADVGGISIDKHGEALLPEVRQLAQSADAVLFGAVVIAFVLAFAFIVAIWFWIRVRWRLRGMRRAQESQAQGRRGGASRAERGRAGQGRIIEAESTVIEERDLRG